MSRLLQLWKREEQEEEADQSPQVDGGDRPQSPPPRTILRKTLVVRLERLDAKKISAEEKGQCVICSRSFVALTMKGRKRPSVSEDLRFVVEKCLGGTTWDTMKKSFYGAFVGKLLCPTHVEVVVEGLRLQQQLKALEKTLEKLRTGVRQAIIKSLAGENTIITPQTQSRDEKYYSEIRKAFRSMTSENLPVNNEFLRMKRKSASPKRKKRVKTAKGEDEANAGNVLTDLSGSDEDCCPQESKIEVKEEPMSPAFHEDQDEKFPAETDTGTLEEQLTSGFILPNDPLTLGSTVIPDAELESNLCDENLNTTMEFEWGGAISPARDSDYCPSAGEHDEDEKSPASAEDDEEFELKPKRVKRQRKRKQSAKRTKPEDIDSQRQVRRRRTKKADESAKIKEPTEQNKLPVVFGPKRAPFWQQRHCPFCHKLCESQHEKLQHIETDHPGKQKYKCKSCEDHFTTSGGLEKHYKRRHVTEKPFKCDICGKDFSSSQLLKHHRLYHFEDKTPVQCSQCQGWYKGRKCLRNHVRYAHTPKIGRRYTKPPDVSCEICQKKYRNMDSLRYHKNKVHLNQHTKAICEECGKELSDTRSLKKHKASQHRQAYRFQCEFCPTRCLYKSHLEAHIRSAHEGLEIKSKSKQESKKNMAPVVDTENEGRSETQNP